MRNLIIRVGVCVGLYIVTHLIAGAFWVGVLCGLIHVRNLRQTLRAVHAGRIIIAVNHPSLPEIFLIPVAFFPFFAGRPWLIPWSVADETLLPRPLRWLYAPMQCVTFTRGDKRSGAACTRTLVKLLAAHASVIIYPEGGRTSKGTAFRTIGSRRIREIQPGLLHIARKAGAQIVPVWVDFGDITSPLSIGQSFLRLMRGHRMTLYFGELLDPHGLSSEELTSILLRTGLTDDHNV